jgi:hypothetical protein
MEQNYMKIEKSLIIYLFSKLYDGSKVISCTNWKMDTRLTTKKNYDNMIQKDSSPTKWFLWF